MEPSVHRSRFTPGQIKHTGEAIFARVERVVTRVEVGHDPKEELSDGAVGGCGTVPCV